MPIIAVEILGLSNWIDLTRTNQNKNRHRALLFLKEMGKERINPNSRTNA